MKKTNRKPKIILDTNVLLVSIPRKSKYRWIFESLIRKDYILYISNDILSEYEEIFKEKFSKEAAENVIEILLIAENVKKIIPYYKWNLINEDPDDNKFVDCAVAANADYIVTNDKHFNVLNDINFPKIETIKAEEFRKLFQK